MRVRIEVQTDDLDISWRYVVTAKEGAAQLHQIKRYGDLEARDLALRELAAWLEDHGYPVPEDYWWWGFDESGVRHWRLWPLPR